VATGLVGNLNPSLADNLIVVHPDGVVKTYFYYFKQGGYQGWIDADGFSPADNAQVPPGSAFFINRQAAGTFTWTIPAE
jgi:hypothetical protein